MPPVRFPLMQPLRLSVVTDGLTVDEISVEIRGLNMDMGLNRTRLTPVAQAATGKAKPSCRCAVKGEWVGSRGAAARKAASGSAISLPYAAPLTLLATAARSLPV